MGFKANGAVQQTIILEKNPFDPLTNVASRAVAFSARISKQNKSARDIKV
jgi:hypothetical protein